MKFFSLNQTLLLGMKLNCQVIGPRLLLGMEVTLQIISLVAINSVILTMKSISFFSQHSDLGVINTYV